MLVIHYAEGIAIKVMNDERRDYTIIFRCHHNTSKGYRFISRFSYEIVKVCDENISTKYLANHRILITD